MGPSQDENEPGLDDPRPEDAAEPVRAPRPAPHLAFCETQCPARMSCPTRLGFRRLAEAHTILGDAYPAQDHPEIDAHLERIEPTIRFFQDLRAACARERHAEHEDHTRTKDALRPLLQELLQEELAKRLQASPAPQAQAAAKSVQLAQPENEVRAEG